jgi:hypothetical protein
MRAPPPGNRHQTGRGRQPRRDDNGHVLRASLDRGRRTVVVHRLTIVVAADEIIDRGGTEPPRRCFGPN